MYRKIGTPFVYYSFFMLTNYENKRIIEIKNIKYMRAGHLFQDRFKSEPVETDEYLLMVVRYI